jgi:SAM-dependent methyltransferase
MSELDIVYSRFIKNLKENPNAELDEEISILTSISEEDVLKSKAGHLFRKLFKQAKNDKTVDIFDYGSGGGMFVLYLKLLGYKSVFGVDVGKEGIKFANEVADKLGFHEPLFFWYNKKVLPFEDKRFDIVISQQVLEHVEDIDAYYKESSRVLKGTGILYGGFPHRLVPYDTHSRTWFIHYFPKPIQRVLYNRFTDQGADYFHDILHLKTISHHKRTALKYFSSFSNTTSERLKNFNEKTYEGQKGLRRMAINLMGLPILGHIFIWLFTKIASVSLELRKEIS